MNNVYENYDVIETQYKALSDNWLGDLMKYRGLGE